MPSTDLEKLDRLLQENAALKAQSNALVNEVEQLRAAIEKDGAVKRRKKRRLTQVRNHPP
jgi:hypothetical protein